MSNRFSRRQFLAGVGVMAAAASTAKGGIFPSPLYAPIDLSYFAEPIRAAASDIRFGYAAITWGGDDVQAIKDVAELGFKGIQLRSNIVSQYSDRPKELRALLDQHGLELVALSSGGVRIGAGTADEEIAKHTKHAKFMHDVGGRYLQVTDSARPRDRKPTEEDFKELGRVMSEIGKRSSDLGIPVGYHNHMNSLGEAPEEVDRIMDASDPRYIKLELDIAHYFQGGGDSAQAIRKYRDRLLFLHIKDVEQLPSDKPGQRPYRFVELGRGKVDLPAVFKALKDVKFRGWAVIELDSVPDKARSPKDSGAISKKYVEEKLGLKIS
jgi:inosose dehydratase